MISTAAAGSSAGSHLQSRQPAGQVKQATLDMCINLAEHIYRLLSADKASGKLSCSSTRPCHVKKETS